MKRWICTVCDYVHEGDQPPEACPVCGAPASDFQLLGEAGDAPAAAMDPTDDAPQTLEQARDLARRRLKGICGVYPSCDGEPNRICQREAYGRPTTMSPARWRPMPGMACSSFIVASFASSGCGTPVTER